ncbi:hypothetical protein LBC_15450 [Campylobacter sp. 19-13652]|nr:hypothetical protein LBC_15450 [Campylobacter sp. 19-13652]
MRRYVGVINFTEIKQSEWEFGVYKSPKLRKLGRFLMRIILIQAKILGAKTLICRVKKENKKAAYLYFSSGFSEYFQDNEYIFLKKTLV